jgi:murein L,D-transpeptidase YcbB/YkuD
MRRRGIVLAALTSLALLVGSGCGDDDPDPTTATPPTTASPTPTSQAQNSATPAPSNATSPTSTSQATGKPVPSESPDDDENGELAGQLIIEYPGTPLRRTSSPTPNPDVEAFQIRLNEVGFTITATGVFDANTERVVKRFQIDTGLPATGVVDADTWAALFTFE